MEGYSRVFDLDAGLLGALGVGTSPGPGAADAALAAALAASPKNSARGSGRSGALARVSFESRGLPRPQKYTKKTSMSPFFFGGGHSILSRRGELFVEGHFRRVCLRGRPQKLFCFTMKANLGDFPTKKKNKFESVFV